MESYSNAGALNTGNSATVGGRRRRSHKLRLVKKSTVRRMLKVKGLKMRGGGEMAASPAAAPVMDAKGGVRRRGGKSTRRRKSRGYSLF
jgi:hypothetical protein